MGAKKEVASKPRDAELSPCEQQSHGPTSSKKLLLPDLMLQPGAVLPRPNHLRASLGLYWKTRRGKEALQIHRR